MDRSRGLHLAVAIFQISHPQPDRLLDDDCTHLLDISVELCLCAALVPHCVGLMRATGMHTNNRLPAMTLPTPNHRSLRCPRASTVCLDMQRGAFTVSSCAVESGSRNPTIHHLFHNHTDSRTSASISDAQIRSTKTSLHPVVLAAQPRALDPSSTSVNTPSNFLTHLPELSQCLHRYPANIRQPTAQQLYLSFHPRPYSHTIQPLIHDPTPATTLHTQSTQPPAPLVTSRMLIKFYFVLCSLVDCE